MIINYHVATTKNKNNNLPSSVGRSGRISRACTQSAAVLQSDCKECFEVLMFTRYFSISLSLAFSVRWAIFMGPSMSKWTSCGAKSMWLTTKFPSGIALCFMLSPKFSDSILVSEENSGCRILMETEIMKTIMIITATWSRDWRHGIPHIPLLLPLLTCRRANLFTVTKLTKQKWLIMYAFFPFFLKLIHMGQMSKCFSSKTMKADFKISQWIIFFLIGFQSTLHNQKENKEKKLK